MIAAQHALNEMLSLEQSLLAALAAAKQKLTALQKVKDAVGDPKKPNPVPIPTGEMPPYWLLYRILNGPTTTLGGGAGSGGG